MYFVLKLEARKNLVSPTRNFRTKNWLHSMQQERFLGNWLPYWPLDKIIYWLYETF